MVKTKQNIDIDYEAQKQPVEYLVLSGGGAKGGMYTGVHEALAESGAFKDIKAISGSSAGAISAALMAAGMNTASIKATFEERGFGDLLGDGPIPIKSIPLLKDGKPIEETVNRSIRNSISDFLLTNDLEERLEFQLFNNRREREKTDLELANKMSELAAVKNLLAKMKKENIDEAQINALDNDSLTLIAEVETLSEKSLELGQRFDKLQKIKSNPDSINKELLQKCLNGGKMTFRDLETMNLIEPSKFKNLHVTATRKDNGELKIFNAADTPDVEIALACHASGALPLALKPVKIDGVTYVDGGFRDNTPYQAFEKKSDKTHDHADDITHDRAKQIEAIKHKRTLAFVFAEETSRGALYSSREVIGSNPGKIRRFLTSIHQKINQKAQSKSAEIDQKKRDNVKISRFDKIKMNILGKLAMVGGKHNYGETIEESAQNMRKHNTTTVLLDSKGVGTIDFKKATKELQHLHASAYIATTEHLKLYRGENNKIKTNDSLPLQSTMLDVVDEIEKSKSSNQWKHKSSTPKDQKNNLLAFVPSQKWKNTPSINVVREYIAAVMTNKNSELTPNIPSADALLKVLNKPSASDASKKAFAEAMGKNSTKDFTKQDLEKFAKDHPELAPAKKQGLGR